MNLTKKDDNQVIDKKSSELVFKKSDGTVINGIIPYIQNWVSKHPNCEIMVGCDSVDRKYKTTYATVIAMYDIGSGAHVITAYTNDKGSMDRITRLWKETEMSITVANNIKEHLEVPISVHFDYNSNKDFISNQLYEAAIGYAKSYGFDAMGKPFAPAASYAADKQCRL